jgi:hypothetical protein
LAGGNLEGEMVEGGKCSKSAAEIFYLENM